MPNLKTHEVYVRELREVNPNMIVIEGYINSSTKILHKCLECNHEWLVRPANALKGYGCPLCAHRRSFGRNLKSHEQFIHEIGEVNKSIIITSTYTKSRDPINAKCLDCGGEWTSIPNRLLNKAGCPFCSHRKVLVGVSDLWTTHPKIAQLLLNKSDGYKFSAGSSHKTNWKCCNCGCVIRNKRIDHISNHGLSCPQCSDGISYPNKYMSVLLNELKVTYETEKSFKWCKYVIDNKVRKGRYDFYFEIEGKSYVVEMDGEWHKKDNVLSGKTCQETIEIDKIKDQLAIKNNIKVIRVSCEKSDFDFISNNVINSELRKVFDFNSVDWDSCLNKLSYPLKLIASDMWNSGKNTSDIALEMKKSISTIVKWLKDCAKLGLCDYSNYKSKQRGFQKYGHPQNKSVVCIDTGVLYKSMQIAGETYGVSNGSIWNCCNGKCKTAGGVKWKYAA